MSSLYHVFLALSLLGLALNSETYCFQGVGIAQKAAGWYNMYECTSVTDSRSSNRPCAEGEEKYSSLLSWRADALSSTQEMPGKKYQQLCQSSHISSVTHTEACGQQESQGCIATSKAGKKRDLCWPALVWGYIPAPLPCLSHKGKI